MSQENVWTDTERSNTYFQSLSKVHAQSDKQESTFSDLKMCVSRHVGRSKTAGPDLVISVSCNKFLSALLQGIIVATKIYYLQALG